jgi:hypothetical protein
MSFYTSRPQVRAQETLRAGRGVGQPDGPSVGDGPDDVGPGVDRAPDRDGVGVAELVGEGEWLADGDALDDRVGLGVVFGVLGVLAEEVEFGPGWVDVADVSGLTQA